VSAAPHRTVLVEIPDAEDREKRVSLITFPDLSGVPDHIEIADYIPSLDVYARGYMFPARHTQKVIAALAVSVSVGTQAVGAAGAAKEITA
jgi:hypothetical protein